MARTDNDTWNLASSVGATATLVAAGRAIASRADRPLIDDRYAEPLVRAVGVELFTKLASGELDPTTVDGGAGAMSMGRMADNMAVRTRFFDGFFADATAAGVRQAVILAAGLDARAYRLAWPDGTTVYEVDQPQVIAFKTAAMAEIGAEPTARRRPVAVDLRDDWPAALRAAGFDPAAPTAWSAEGLLAYLPADAQDRLLDTVTTLSAPGSRFAVESVPGLTDLDAETVRTQLAAAAAAWQDQGLDLDATELIYFGDRNEAAGYLAERGWTVRTAGINELFAANGLAPLPETTGFTDLIYATAVLG